MQDQYKSVEIDSNGLQNLATESLMINSIINESIFEKGIEEVGELKLVKVRDHIKKLLVHIRTLEEQLARRDTRIQQLEDQLESKNGQVLFLQQTKQQIDKSVQQIMLFNKEYLRVIESKNMEIANLERSLNKWASPPIHTPRLNQRQQQQPDIYRPSMSYGLPKGQCRITDRRTSSSAKKNNVASSVKGGSSQSKNKSILNNIKKYISDTQQKFRGENGERDSTSNGPDSRI